MLILIGGKMNAKMILLLTLVVSIFLVGCQRSDTTGYAAYNQPQGQPQGGQYVGGGCGVAPSGDYESTPIEALDPKDSAL